MVDSCNSMVNSSSAVYLPCKLESCEGSHYFRVGSLNWELGIYTTETFALAQRQIGRSKGSRILALDDTIQCKDVKISERCFTCE